jgi:predicted RNA binding protein YcfA (HicA-like mRNA interferase family)
MLKKNEGRNNKREMKHAALRDVWIKLRAKGSHRIPS